MENNPNIKSEAISESIDEEQLAEVAGGSGLTRKCYFQPTGRVRAADHVGVAEKMEAECSALCKSGFICRCHGENHCVGKWHLINPETRELLPGGFSNHQEKKASNGYNT